MAHKMESYEGPVVGSSNCITLEASSKDVIPINPKYGRQYGDCACPQFLSIEELERRFYEEVQNNSTCKERWKLLYKDLERQQAEKASLRKRYSELQSKLYEVRREMSSIAKRKEHIIANMGSVRDKSNRKLRIAGQHWAIIVTIARSIRKKIIKQMVIEYAANIPKTEKGKQHGEDNEAWQSVRLQVPRQERSASATEPGNVEQGSSCAPGIDSRPGQDGDGSQSGGVDRAVPSVSDQREEGKQ